MALSATSLLCRVGNRARSIQTAVNIVLLLSQTLCNDDYHMWNVYYFTFWYLWKPYKLDADTIFKLLTLSWVRFSVLVNIVILIWFPHSCSYVMFPLTVGSLDARIQPHQLWDCVRLWVHTFYPGPWKSLYIKEKQVRSFIQYKGVLIAPILWLDS